MDKDYSTKEISLALKTLQLYFESSNHQICENSNISMDKYYRLINGYDKLGKQSLKKILACYLVGEKEFFSNSNEIHILYNKFVDSYIFADNDEMKQVVQKLIENEEVFESSITFYIVILLNYAQKVRKYEDTARERKIILKIYSLLNDNDKAFFNLFYSLELRRIHKLDEAGFRIEESLGNCTNKLRSMLVYHKIIIKLKQNSLAHIQNDFDICKKQFLYDQNFNRYLEIICHEAIYYVKIFQYDMAIEIFKTARNTAEREENSRLKNLINDNLVWVYILKKDYQQALNYVDESFTNDIACFHKGYLYHKLGNIQKSDRYIQMALSRNLNNRTVLIKLIRYVSILNAGNERKILNYLESLEKLLLNGKKYDVEDLIFVYNEVIDFYETKEKYKEATEYYHKLIKIIC
ncbi:tetratricopeptide repeat protein [Holdemania massiliensis]|uniref:tetratricopeptide repeat protein n=1 Tax=Holdemania massiliensis TaxID=1468449 RepID=UPI001F065AE1|nr:hypothetical protein [Holdemania massiliensis]MCH1939161.1 hypothetical protein [Holdemania massiliensis]